MIRINLLGVERNSAGKSAAFSFTLAQSAPLFGAAILVTALGGVGWWYWSLSQTSAQLEAEVIAKRQEADRLKSVTAEVQRFEQRRAQLQERVSLIEKLRTGQSIPVQLLDHVSRSLPEMLWLTDLQQDNGALTIQGRSTTLIGLSDFVGNLASNTVLQKPIEIVKSEVTASDIPGGGTAELIEFTVRAHVAGTAADDAAATTAAAPKR